MLVAALCLAFGAHGLPGDAGAARNNGQHQAGGHGDADPVAAGEHEEQGKGADVAGGNRAMAPAASDIQREGFGGAVALVGVGFQGFGDDGIQIPGQCAAQLFGGETGHRRGVIGNYFRRGSRRVARVGAPLRIRTKWPGAGEEFMQNHAERIKVYRGGDGLSGELFGGGIPGGGQATADLGELGGAVVGICR